MNMYEKGARYLMGLIYLMGSIDGACYLFGGMYLTGEPHGPFLTGLMVSTYFWAFMKIVELIGAISLLLNYKPAVGISILTPITAVICLYYLFEAVLFIPLGFLMVVATVILFKSYSKSFMPLLEDQ